MLDTLITSKTRIKLLLKFFLNSNNTSYLRDLETEFGESSNAIRLELNRFEKAGMLTSTVKGNRKYYQANVSHPLFCDVQNILLKYMGIDKVVDKVIRKLGMLQKAYLTGNMARGCDCNCIDLLLVGDQIDLDYLTHLVEKAEGLISRKIRYEVMSPPDAENYIHNGKAYLLLWQMD